jgi:hypothetical protein
MNTPCLIIFSNQFAPNVSNIFSKSNIEEIIYKLSDCRNPYINRLKDLVENIEGKRYSHITIITNELDSGLLLAKMNGTFEVICRFNNEDTLNMAFNLFDLMCTYNCKKDDFTVEDFFVEDDAETFFQKNDLNELNEIKDSMKLSLTDAIAVNEKLFAKIVEIYETQIKV